MAPDGMRHFLAGWVRIVIQKRFGRHDHPRRAVATLHPTGFSEGLLDWMGFLGIAQPLDGGDVAAG